MLHIFADALLIAARQEPLPRRPELARRPIPEDRIASPTDHARRRWFGLMGVRL